MKGKISPKLERVLQDSTARNQLRNSLIKGGDGRVTLGTKTYNLRTDVQKSINTTVVQRNQGVEER